jgi:broad specificity phosphatase PhoE
MSAQNALTPRVFLYRHGKSSIWSYPKPYNNPLVDETRLIGETDWAKWGRSTGTTEIKLNQTGAAQVSSAAAILVGPNKLLDPRRFKRIFVSPRERAKQTFKLLLEPYLDLIEEKLIYTEDIAEWNYGDYEGLKNDEIRGLRLNRGHDKEREWDIWTDGCEGGEYVVPCSR